MSIEFNQERIMAGLPDTPVEVPDHILIAHKDGVIKPEDVKHNLHAHISANSRPNLVPALNTYEEVERSRIIYEIASKSVEVCLGLEPDMDGPW